VQRGPAQRLAEKLREVVRERLARPQPGPLQGDRVERKGKRLRACQGGEKPGRAAGRPCGGGLAPGLGGSGNMPDLGRV